MKQPTGNIQNINLDDIPNLSAKNDSSYVVDFILDDIKNGHNIFLTGGAGVGKSYVINSIKSKISGCVLVSPTGIAAANIGGATIHSTFELPTNTEAKLKPMQFEDNIERLQNCRLLIIDEISMVDSFIFGWIQKRLKQLKVNPTIMVVGDFYQLPPVNVDKSDFAFGSDIWSSYNFKNYNLTKVYRSDDKEFIDALNDLRVGQVSQDAEKVLKDLAQHDYFDTYTHLYSTNKKAFFHNKKMIDKIDAPTYKHSMYERYEGDSYGDQKVYDAAKKDIKSRFEEHLYLKEGALVMFTYNDRANRVYNGKKGYITKLTKESIYIDEIEVKPYKHEVKTYVKGEERLIGYFIQYPIKLAYAITIHKSQGMSIDELYVDLTYIFAPGQAYVALSRAKDPQKTAVLLPYNKSIEKVFYTNPAICDFYQILIN